jgi:predicted nucleic acid-binding Zn ribbon protein
MSDDPIKDCPECGKAVRRNIFGGSGVIFKGSGFYVNDSRGKNPAAPSASKSNSGDAASGGKPSDASSDKAASPGQAAPASSGTAAAKEKA